MNARSITLSAGCIWLSSLAMAACDRFANDGVPAFAVVRPEPSRVTPLLVREAQAAPAAPHRCALEGEPHTIAPRAALDTGLTLAAAGNALALGWAVPGAHPAPAGVAIGLDGAPGARIEPTLPALPRELQRWTHNAPGTTAAIFHVVPFVTTDGRTTLQVDRRIDIPNEGRHELVLQCGSIADLVTSVDPNADMNGNNSDFAACHTMPIGGEPVVVTIMLQSSREGVDYHVSLHVSRGPIARGAAPAATHLLEVGNSGAEREEAEGETRVFLRRYTAAFEPQLIAAPGGGYALTFRDGHGLYLTWLDAAFHARGPTARVATLGGTPGVARLATNGREVLMMWADRASDATPGRGRTPAAPGSNRYALHVRHFAPGAAPGSDAPARLATTSAEVNAADGEQDEFAPSVTALDDGTWLVAWSRGPLRANRNGRPAQNVFVRHYGADLAPLGDAMRIESAEGASDARVIARQGRFVVAALAGRGAAREIRTYAGRCDLP